MPDQELRSVLEEIIRTQGDLRYRISAKYRYDERWADLCPLSRTRRISRRPSYSITSSARAAVTAESQPECLGELDGGKQDQRLQVRIPLCDL